MKHILITVSCVLLSLSMHGQNEGIRFFEGSFSDVKKQAASSAGNGKLIFFDCYTSWCGPCKRMAKEFFTLKEAGDFFNANFINYKADMEKGEGIELAKNYKISMYPTFLILDATGAEVGRVLGGTLTLNDFIEKVKIAMDPKNSLTYLSEVYSKNKTYANALNYLRTCIASGKTDEIYNFTNEVFPSLDLYERTNDDIWKFIVLGVKTLDSPILTFINENREEIDPLVGPERVNNSLLKIYKRILSNYFQGGYTLSAEQLKQIKYTASLINSQDKALNIRLAIAQALASNNIAGLSEIMNPNKLAYSLNTLEMLQLENTVSKIKAIPQEVMANYYKQKRTMLQGQIEKIPVTQ